MPHPSRDGPQKCSDAISSVLLVTLFYPSTCLRLNAIASSAKVEARMNARPTAYYDHLTT